MIQQSYFWAYIRRKLIQKDTCTLTFIAAWFTMAKTWEQPKYPWKMWYVYKMEYYSAIKKDEIMPFGAM